LVPKFSETIIAQQIMLEHCRVSTSLHLEVRLRCEVSARKQQIHVGRGIDSMPTASGHTKAIRASRVIGAGVFIASGDKIGHLEDIILDKTADRIMFAVIGRSGMLVAVDNYYPIPWSDLDYDEEKEGYILSYGIDELEKLSAVSAIDELTEKDGALVL
jgi:sporulation protein YlmC with PRC-barrel domain